MGKSSAPQGWITNRVSDSLFFIGTPLLSLALLQSAANYFSSFDIALFVLAFFAVGHHLPGLMRAYGERELFDRYKARFIVSPVVIIVCVGWSVFNGHLGFFIFLALWDMWHFFMQHYGFMRIYDVKRHKPSRLSGRLDWLLTAICFTYIVVASPHYLVNFMERCHRYGFGLYTWFQPEYIPVLRQILLVLAVAISVVYVIHLVRLSRQGVPVVWPKLAITATTFLTVYYAYIVLDDVILGYAITALAHDIQYFAIVWIYNHGVLKRSNRLGASFFRYLFADGRFRIILIYLALILAYGGVEAMARATENYLIYDLVKILIATTAFMHYYYDGFMWKVHKKEIRQNFVADETGTDEPDDGLGTVDRLRLLINRWPGFSYVFETGKQLVYFGVPILFFAWTDATYSLSTLEAKEYLARLTPEVAKVHDDLGVAYSREGKVSQAIASHKKALAIDSTYATAYTHLGIAYSVAGQRQQAIRYHKQALVRDADLAPAHYNLGVEYFQMGRLDKAVASFEQAVKLDGEYQRAYMALGRAYQRQGKPEEMEKYLEKARQLQRVSLRKELSRSAMPWATGTPVKSDS